MTKTKRRVGIIFGGQSGEHEVSLTSAKNVMDAMDKNKYEIVPIGISKTGLWLSGPDVMARLTTEAKLPPRLSAASTKTETDMGLLPFLDASVLPEKSNLGNLDVIFPILHGPMGEDGTVQGLLELANYPYVGCGVTGSATAMDKAIAKDIFVANGLPIVPHQTILRKKWLDEPAETIASLEATLSYPLFVKPANMGSSVGVSKAHNQAELQTALAEAAKYDRKLIVEQGIDAREIEISILGNDEPIASVPGEVVPSREFYSYASKYIDEDSNLLIPAPLSLELGASIQKHALTAFRVLDCAGLARVDFLLDKASDEIYINEVNTLPGFTAISMYPKLWQASGLDYPSLIDRLIELALERHAEKQQTHRFFNVAEAT